MSKEKYYTIWETMTLILDGCSEYVAQVKRKVGLLRGNTFEFKYWSRRNKYSEMIKIPFSSHTRAAYSDQPFENRTMYAR